MVVVEAVPVAVAEDRDTDIRDIADMAVVVAAVDRSFVHAPNQNLPLAAHFQSTDAPNQSHPEQEHLRAFDAPNRIHPVEVLAGMDRDKDMEDNRGADTDMDNQEADTAGSHLAQDIHQAEDIHPAADRQVLLALAVASPDSFWIV